MGQSGPRGIEHSSVFKLIVLNLTVQIPNIALHFVLQAYLGVWSYLTTFGAFFLFSLSCFVAALREPSRDINTAQHIINESFPVSGCVILSL